jgi:hypothetical protein
MNVLRGLSERFHTLRLFLKKQRPLPTFVEIRSELLLEELTTASAAPQPPTALVASGTLASDGSSGVPSTGSSSGGRGSSGDGNRRRRRGRGSGSGGQSAGSSAGSGTPGGGGSSTSTPRATTWPTIYNPWTGTIQMWPDPVQVGTAGHLRRLGRPARRLGRLSRRSRPGLLPFRLQQLGRPWSSWAATCSSSCCCSTGLLAHACCWRYWLMGSAGPCQYLQHHDSNTSIFVW